MGCVPWSPLAPSGAFNAQRTLSQSLLLLRQTLLCLLFHLTVKGIQVQLHGNTTARRHAHHHTKMYAENDSR